MNIMMQEVYYEYHDIRSSHHRLTYHLLLNFEDTAFLACVVAHRLFVPIPFLSV